MANHNSKIERTRIATAIEALGWRWLQDAEGVYRVRVASDAVHGNLETEYCLSLDTEMGNLLRFRLYGCEWFLGRPDAMRDACEEWNLGAPYPKASLVVDREGDSKLVLEWAIPCFDESVPQPLINAWLREFSEACAYFLEAFADAISSVPRFAPMADPRDLN